MRQYAYISTLSMVLFLFISGCGKNAPAKETLSEEQDHLIFISKKQMDSEGIKLGEATKKLFDELLTCNGYIMAPPDGIAQISTPISGIVETINCTQGDFVRKGEVLGNILSDELIVLQQDFVETSAKLIRLKSDYDRIKTLYDENIGAEKDFIAIESDYKAMTAKYNSLKIRLELLRLNAVKIENGEFVSTYPMVAPIKGYITNMNLILGQFTEQQKSLIEIVDVSKLQLRISVFQEKIGMIKPGQEVRFNSLGDRSVVYPATIISIGRAIDPETKTIQCTAKINMEAGTDFTNNSYTEATVVVNQTEAFALPDGAILKSDNENYVFMVNSSDNDGYFLKKVKVTVGRVYSGFTEIVDVVFPGKVLIDGVYNLQSKSD